MVILLKLWTCPLLCKHWYAEHVLNNGKNMEPKVYVLPRELDEEVAKIKLHSMGYDLDALTQDQIDYLTKVN